MALSRPLELPILLHFEKQRAWTAAIPPIENGQEDHPSRQLRHDPRRSCLAGLTKDRPRALR